MSSHISHHLERFALLVLPKQAELDEESDNDGRGSLQTKDAAVRAAGPKDDDDSRAGDFDMSLPLEFRDYDFKAIGKAPVSSLEKAPSLSREMLNQSLVEPPPSPAKQTTRWLDEVDGELDGVPDPREIWLAKPPLRLINVTSDDNKEIRLENRETTERRVRYACLTGLLGPGFTAPTTKSNVAERLSSLAGCHRSLTIWMAIRACRKLGIPYLWQQDLCLVNDDLDESHWFRDNVEGLYERAEHVWLTRSQIPQEDDKLLKVEAEAYFAKKMRGPDDDCNDRSAVKLEWLSSPWFPRSSKYLDEESDRVGRKSILEPSRPSEKIQPSNSGSPDALSSLGQILGDEASKETPQQRYIDIRQEAAFRTVHGTLQDNARKLYVEDSRAGKKRSKKPNLFG